jgi:aldehyde dehydrogenase (NAD+)
MAEMVIEEPRLTVDGELRAASDGATYTNQDPTTEEIIGVAGDATVGDAAEAIAAARRAFDTTSWSQDLDFLIHCLEQLKAATIANTDALREILISEAGCPLSFTRGVQLDLATGPIDDAIALARDYEWETPLPGDDRSAPILRREPRGVVAAITAFNYPLFLNLRKVAPALASGCTVILKPSPSTPWSASFLGRMAVEETDLPPGVLNVLTSSRPEVGVELTSSAGVDMVTFVGSSAVGRSIMAQAAPTLKKLVLELGGKSASIILEDADVAAAATVAAGVGLHSGQGCARLTRFLVHRSRFDEAVESATAAFGKIVVGDPRDESVIQGPQITEAQQSKVFGLIERALGEGAKAAFGGPERPERLERGWFTQPTLLVDVEPDSEIAQTEVFGPVAVMIPFDTDDEAVAIANNSAYGLNGAVTSGDLDRALSVARLIRTGQVIVNGGGTGPAAPFGGHKQSGIGVDNGPMGFAEHLNVKPLGLPAR